MRKLICFGILLAFVATHGEAIAATNNPTAIPWSEIGTKAGTDYSGDGLAVRPTEYGASLHCVFQRLDGEATSEGLWLTSTVSNTMSERFRVTAMEVGRKMAHTNRNSQWAESSAQLTRTGDVSIEGQTVRFVRPGLTEEYSVSMDGLRQDLIVEQAPPSPPADELVVKLAVAGAKVEPAAYGACLVLDNSGRKISYSRLRVTDATGKVLPGRIEVFPAGDEGNFCEELGLLTPVSTEAKLAVVVNDSGAVYPLRIDPTFSDANWISLGGIPGANGTVYAAACDASGNLYIGGNFTQVGNAEAAYIAEWNGDNWLPLGLGMNSAVYCIAMAGNVLYAGGDFSTAGDDTNANYIAQWNGSEWSSLDSGMDADVSALAVSGTTLYAGGNFGEAGGISANNIAQWNGTNWSALGSGVDSAVGCLAVSDGILYAGGQWYTGIAQWNGTKWLPLGNGLTSSGGFPRIEALAVLNGILYAGGAFNQAGGANVTNIAQWNGNTWSALGIGINGGVATLVSSGSNLLVGGSFSSAGGVAVTNVAQWSGSAWSSLGPGLGEVMSAFRGEVATIAVSGTNVYAGGTFSTALSGPANYISKLSGNHWVQVNAGGANGTITAMALSGETLYIGGVFTNIGTLRANYVAQWNGADWSALGNGVNGVVYALATSGNLLYAGGRVFPVAQWDGTAWSGLGDGVDNTVWALAVSGNILYAGGDFTMAGDTNANYIAQCDGTNWSSVGAGMNESVYALAVSGGILYAGGKFTTAGTDTNANGIAQWNGSAWSGLAGGLQGGGDVMALAMSGNTLYAGGFFLNVGGTPANDIAQWNGSSWSALGSGIGPRVGYYGASVNALAISGGTLYAGGYFTNTGDGQAVNVAEWNGSSWSALGSGVNGTVSALAVSGSTLYAGGQFTTAGTNVSYYVAEALLGGAPLSYTITLSASPIAAGMVSGGGTFAAGSLQTVIATANSGYAFVDWTEGGTVVSSLSNYTITLNSNVALVANFTTSQTNAFCAEIQTANSSGISYDSGLFTYTDSDASDAKEEHAILPLCGAAASAVTSTNAWTASISVNLSARTLTAATSHAELGLVVSTNLSGPLSSTGFVFELVQENNTGDGDGGSTDIYPDGWYGTALSFQALVNGARDPATPLGGSQATGNGSIYLLLSGTTTNAGSTESIDSASGILTITYDPSNETVIGTYNGTNVASYSLARWGSNPPLALGVWGGSGKLLAVSSGTATANNFSASAVASSGPAPLSLVTNSGAFGFTNGVFGFSISGPAGSNVVIEVSADLKTWIPLQTNVLGSAPLYYSDSQSPTNRQRFYRAVEP